MDGGGRAAPGTAAEEVGQRRERLPRMRAGVALFCPLPQGHVSGAKWRVQGGTDRLGKVTIMGAVPRIGVISGA